MGLDAGADMRGCLHAPWVCCPTRAHAPAGNPGRATSTIRTRVLRLLWRRGVFLEADDDSRDPLPETSLALAGVTGAAVQGRSALGPRTGARVLQLGRVRG